MTGRQGLRAGPAADPGWPASYAELRFLELGRTRAAGVDCWGLVRLVFAERLGIELPALLGEYESVAEIRAIGSIIGREACGWWRMNGAAPRAFDVVVLRGGPRPWHVGCMFNASEFIHIEPDAEVSVGRLDGMAFRDRLSAPGGVFRHDDLTDGLDRD